MQNTIRRKPKARSKESREGLTYYCGNCGATVKMPDSFCSHPCWWAFQRDYEHSYAAGWRMK